MIEINALIRDDFTKDPLVLVIFPVRAMKGETPVAAISEIKFMERAREAVRPPPLRQQRGIGMGLEDFGPRMRDKPGGLDFITAHDSSGCGGDLSQC